MSDEHEHSHDHEHQHEGHDHDHDHDRALIVERMPEGAWSVDPHGSEVVFKARALFGLLPVTGIFERFSGELVVDQAGGVGGRLVVQTASIDSGLGRRDADLRSASYFDSQSYPEMIFTLEQLEPGGSEHLKLRGALQIQARTVPLSFPVQAIAHGDHLHLEGGVTIDLQAAGLGWSKPGMVGKRVRAEAALTLTRA